MVGPGALPRCLFDPPVTIVNEGCFVMLTFLSPVEHALKSAPKRPISLQNMLACRDRAVHLAAHDTRC
jgi:hypothetical protein